MSNRTVLVAAAAAIAIAAPALAQNLAPMEDHSIDLGQVSGDAYYAVGRDGFHVVATFTRPHGAGAPIRFQAILAPGQSVIVSSPGREGEQPASLEITRQNDQIVVRRSDVID